MTGKNREFAAKVRVLIIEVNWLGDVLFSTPAVRAIRNKFPGAYIAALVVPRCKQALLGNNYLDEVMVYDEEGRHKGFWGQLRLARELRARRFSVAYLFKNSGTRGFWAFLAGIGRRIGFGKGVKGLFLTERIPYPKEKMHRADVFYYLVNGSRIPDGQRYYDFFVTQEDKNFISDFLRKHGIDRSKKIVSLHVGGNWELKRWPKENFARLIDRLAESYQVQPIITGSFLDHPLAKIISQMCVRKPLIACGATTLKQLGALFQMSDVVISADSGPLHIATAVDAKTIAIFGPTDPEITGPLGRGDFSVIKKKDLECVIPCYNLKCEENVCMKEISVDNIIELIEKKAWLKVRQ
ncbi:MAG TPA: lipopolysaccharide heptosyltransferase II [Candidatus Omnitrophota bacterium]|nr:lipopolysaccharide heptosyltransferase II [Candidatus Omnitrophota bacterium]